MKGGDYSVTYPEARSFDQLKDLCIIQFDANLDFGQRIYTNGSPTRLISQLLHLKKKYQIGCGGWAPTSARTSIPRMASALS